MFSRESQVRAPESIAGSPYQGGKRPLSVKEFKIVFETIVHATGRCAYMKVLSSFAIVYGVNRNHSALRCDFRFDRRARCSVISHMDDLVAQDVKSTMSKVSRGGRWATRLEFAGQLLSF